MDFRRRPRSTALATLGSLALASVLLAGGCAAPKNSEKARFGTVVGTVNDSQGNPVVGARVTIIDQATPTSIGTRNYFGPRGPFVTNSRGRFVVSGVAANATDTVVLNFRVEKDGFIATTAGHTVFEETVVPGTNRVIPAGAQTADIVVNGLTITDVSAVLAMAAPATQVSTSGATVQASVPQVIAATIAGQAPPPAPVAPASIQIPAGALQESTPISITPIVSASLTAPVTYAVDTQGTVVAPQTTISAGVSAGAVNLQPEGLTFPANARPTVRLPLSFTSADIPAGTHLPVNWFNPNTSQWEYAVDAVVEAVNGMAVAVFQVEHFSTYQCPIPVKWQFGAAEFLLNTNWVTVPSAGPAASSLQALLKTAGSPLPGGGTYGAGNYSPLLYPNATQYAASGTRYPNVLPFLLTYTAPAPSGPQSAFLASSFEQLTGVVGSAAGNEDINVPAGNGAFVAAVKSRFALTATIQLSKVDASAQDRQFQGYRVYWTQFSSNLPFGQALQQLINPPVPQDNTVITHVQGGGVEF